jgi:hypothetical protein
MSYKLDHFLLCVCAGGPPPCARLLIPPHHTYPPASLRDRLAVNQRDNGQTGFEFARAAKCVDVERILLSCPDIAEFQRSV